MRKEILSQMNTLKTEIRDFIIRNYCFNQSALLSDDTSLMESGLVDSTGVLELVSFLEETYCLAVAAEDLVPENLDSVNSLVSFVFKKVGTAAPHNPNGVDPDVDRSTQSDQVSDPAVI